MSEIEKMYENAGIKPLCQIPDEYCGLKNVYEAFTAEKQIELIKWLTNKHNCYDFDLGQINLAAEIFEEGIASAINSLWRFLTEEEKQQIKEILE